jgi:hypothetical protein
MDECKPLGGGVIDLLLTSEWPSGIDKFTRDKDNAEPAAAAAAAGSPVVAELARDLQPR